MHTWRNMRSRGLRNIVVFLVLAAGLVSMPTERAWATVQPQDESEWMVPMGLSLVALSVPLGVNTYSAVSEKPVSPLWHWSGYLFGGLFAFGGMMSLAGNLTRYDPSTPDTYLSAAVFGYGLWQFLAAYHASEIEPENTAGVLMPMVGADEFGAQRVGLTWVKRF